MNNIYILLPVHNRKLITERFIKCLCEQTYKLFHLILIDDGSTDGTEDMVRRFVDESRLTVLKGNGNLWWAGSLQLGINWLNKNSDKESLVLFINDDVTFNATFLENGVNFIIRKNNTLLLAKLFDRDAGKVIESGVTADLNKFTFNIAEDEKSINCLSTRGLFLRLKYANKIGGFCPGILPHYWSDYEFSIRAFRKGFNLATCDDVYLTEDKSCSGYHSLTNDSFSKFITRIFSKKTIPNPIYRSSFILLACPIQSMPVLLVKTWIKFFELLSVKMVGSFKRYLKYYFLKIMLVFNTKNGKSF